MNNAYAGRRWGYRRNDRTAIHSVLENALVVAEVAHAYIKSDFNGSRSKFKKKVLLALMSEHKMQMSLDLSNALNLVVKRRGDADWNKAMLIAEKKMERCPKKKVKR